MLSHSITNISDFWRQRNNQIVLSLIVVGMLIRLYVMFIHNITPDETWHLADGVFLANGKIPMVDYSARQPLYVFLLGAFVKVFGAHYLSGRFLLLLASIGTLIFCYLISKLWFDNKVALLALSGYILFPFVIIWEPVIQEQGLVIFFNCAAIYFGSFSILKEQNKKYLFISGVLFGCAYYCRQTGLASLAALFVFISIYEKFNIRSIVQKYWLIILGFFAVAAAFFIFYLNFMSITELLDTEINPLYIIMSNVVHLTSNIGTETTGNEASFRLNLQNIAISKDYLSLTIQYNYVLMVAMLSSILVFAIQIFFSKYRKKGDISKIIFFLCWVAITAIFYGYHYFQRGFYPQYIREFQLPLMILFAYSVFYFVRASISDDRILKWIILVFGISLVLGVLYKYIFESYPSKLLIVFITGLFFTSLVLVKQIKKSELKVLLRIEKWPFWGVLMLLAGTFIYTCAQSGRFLSVQYLSMWSPKMLKNVVTSIVNHSNKNDGVLAGSPLWAIQSNRKIIPPYTHPAIFSIGISEEEKQEIHELIVGDSPKIIVVDNYTRSLYLKNFPWIKEYMEANYILTNTFSEIEYERIEIYKRR